MNRNNHGSIATYVIIALILGVITYIEFAIVEYEIAWLSRNAIMISLVVMTVVKFLLVVMFFMHLKGDDRIYSGFFTSGMILGLGTFIGLAFLFTVTSVSNYTFTNVSPPETLEETAEVGPPGPVDQTQPVVPPPAADQDDFAVGEEGAVEVAVAAFDTAAAEAAYMANCASCHQATGAGLPGAFPPMADHADDLYNAEGGPEFLMHAVVFGIQGPIEVNGVDYNAAMPAWNHLDDETLADSLNHISTAWGNDEGLIDFEPFTAEDIAGVRGDGLSPSDVHASRLALDLDAAPAPAPAEPEEVAADEPAEEPVEEPAEEPAEEPSEEPAEEPADEPAAEPAEEPAAAVAAGIDMAAGEVVFQSHCFACHQAGGEGIPSVFPPLAGNAADLYNLPGGREYLLQAVLFGVQGPLEVNGVSYNGSMPGWTQLSDDNIADVLNYTTNAWENAAILQDFEPYTAEEVADQRPATLTGTDVLANRPDAADSEPAEDEPAEDEPVQEAEEVTEAEPAAPSVAAQFDRDAAEAAYAANCSSCHAATGAGIPQVFPPLAGHADEIYNLDGGREFLMNVMLYGMTGSITVDGVTYGGAMPAWNNLTDETLADAFNHIVTAWGNEDALSGFEPMTADELAAQRGLGLSTSDVHAQRQELGLD